jgi:hypothetical protein
MLLLDSARDARDRASRTGAGDKRVDFTGRGLRCGGGCRRHGVDNFGPCRQLVREGVVDLHTENKNQLSSYQTQTKKKQ